MSRSNSTNRRRHKAVLKRRARDARAQAKAEKQARLAAKTPNTASASTLSAAFNMAAVPRVPRHAHLRLNTRHKSEADLRVMTEDRLLALTGAALGRSLRRHLPDTFAPDDRRVPLQSRLPVKLPEFMPQEKPLRRGMADLNGITWASLPREVRNAMDSLNGDQTACFMGFMAARARHLLRTPLFREGLGDNIGEAEAVMFDYFDAYPVSRLEGTFNAQAYALALQMLDPGQDNDLLHAVAGKARDNVYLDPMLRLESLMKDSDLMAMTLDDVRAFAHVVSRHFKLSDKQEQAFAMLVSVRGPEPEVEKTPDGRHVLRADELDRKYIHKPQKHKFDIDLIARTAGVEYTAPDTSFDEVARIEDIAYLAEGRKVHERLVAANPVLISTAAAIARQLSDKLRTGGHLQWDSAQEEGILDPARLTALVTDPSIADIYRRATEEKKHDTTVTLLIDNSGSMLGEKIQLAYVTTLFVAGALERANIPYEVLGFTTVEGARRNNATEGRQDVLRQIIYKAHHDRRIDPHALAGMLCRGILSGTPTSEALVWAANRLLERNEKRKILLSVEDGDPSVTLGGLAYDEQKQIARNHLRAVAEAIENHGGIELAGIGIKHDVSAFYANNIRVDRSEQLPMAVSSLLDLLLVQRRAANPRLLGQIQKRLNRKDSGPAPAYTAAS